MPRSATIILNSLILMFALNGCSRGRPEQQSHTGLLPGMTASETVKIMGNPDTLKPAGQKKEIFVYRRTNEIISVFFINGKIKNIEHIRRDPRIQH